MTETNLQERSNAPDEQAERIAAVFACLDKVIRGSKLYRGEGPMLERMMDDLEQKAITMLQHGSVAMRVASIGLVYQGVPVGADEKRNPYLFRLFCDGVRELSIIEGLERWELKALAEILGSDAKGDDDVVTMLWRRELPHVRYYAADTFAEGVEVDANGEVIVGKSAGRLEQAGSEQAITLSPDDIRMLGGEGHLAWVQEARAPLRARGRMQEVAARIRESFQTPRDTRRFIGLAIRQSAIHAATEGTIPASPMALGVWEATAGAGNAQGLADILDVVQETTKSPDEAMRSAATSLLVALTRPVRIKAIAPVIEREPDLLLPRLEAVVDLAKEALVALLADVGVGPARERLHDVLKRSGLDLTPYYQAQLEAEDEKVVVAAITALGQLATPPALQALAQALGRTSASIRKAALEAMIGKYDATARIGLVRALRDPAKECRLLALQVLATSGDGRVAWGLLATVEEGSFGQKDPDEQAAFYRALAAYHDDRTIAHFKKVLSQKNLMRSKAANAQQMLAVQALAEVGTDEARKTLEEFRAFRFHSREVGAAIEAALSRRTRV